MSVGKKKLKFRSQNWFDNPDNADMTALYLERYLNYGFTRGELQGGKPIIGIAQTGSDLSPCNRAHVDLVKRVRDGITAAGGVPLEFPIHPIQETGKRPTASWTAISLTSRLLKCFMATPSMAWCSPSAATRPRLPA